MDCFSEHHVRAVTQRLLLARRGRDAYERLAATDVKEGYRFTPAVTAALERYEADRARWPTLLDFMPTWLKSWEGLK